MTTVTGGTDAGVKLLPYYDVVRAFFPVLPAHAEIAVDTAINTFGLAWCYGLDDDGEPVFAVRDDIDVDSVWYVPFHECGHAFMYVVARERAAQRGTSYQEEIEALRERYWSFRGFPQTWLDAQVRAEGGGGWRYYPDESWADAFAHVMFALHPLGPMPGEWTENYGGTPIWQRDDALAFFISLMEEVQAVLTDADKDDIAKRVAALVLPEIVGALKSGFNVTLPTLLDRLAAGDKHVATTPID